MNTYGKHFRVTTYGESHGLAVGAIIDGCPAGIAIDMEAINSALDQRRIDAPRKEEDKVLFLSGVKEGITLGTPIAFEVANSSARPSDYDILEHCFRPGHADYTYYMKYGMRDYRGGGRASARETVARVIAGCIARQLMPDVTIKATVEIPLPDRINDTRGGIVTCKVTGVPVGVGEPLFGKLNSELAAAMMSIPSAIGFEMGTGFNAANMYGSEYIDRWNRDGSTITNHCGGVQGGICNGMPLEFRVAFHPVATIPQEVECLGEDSNLHSITVGGRHDRCAVQRAPIIVESMTALCLINSL